MRHVTACLIICGVGPVALAQEAVRLHESFAPGYQYHVSSRVDISGSLALPVEKDGKGPASLPLVGKSAVEYDERILPPAKDGKDGRTFRVVRRLEFERKVGDEAQRLNLRHEVRRLVLLRHRQFEVPFSPDGPLTWNEIDLVRTDVFTPALAGLLPAGAVKPGDTWSAGEDALRELTDVEKLEGAKLTCQFETVTTLVGKRLARVTFQGVVEGVGEDGKARHELAGHYLFDLDSNHLSYLYVKGSHILLDKEGRPRGKIDGSFVLTREPLATHKELSDDALRGLNLEPNDENTLLLADVPELGVRFLHPRRWRLTNVNGKQITLDEQKGSGLLITVEPLSRTPSGAQFLKEARDWLGAKKAPVFKQEGPRVLPGAAHIEQFTLDAEVDKQRIWLDYYVVHQSRGGATFAARLTTDLTELQRDVARMARSLEIGKAP